MTKLITLRGTFEDYQAYLAQKPLSVEYEYLDSGGKLTTKDRIKVEAITHNDHPQSTKLEAIDPAEAQFLISNFAFSTSRPRKA